MNTQQQVHLLGGPAAGLVLPLEDFHNGIYRYPVPPPPATYTFTYSASDKMEDLTFSIVDYVVKEWRFPPYEGSDTLYFGIQCGSNFANEVLKMFQYYQKFLNRGDI